MRRSGARPLRVQTGRDMKRAECGLILAGALALSSAGAAGGVDALIGQLHSTHVEVRSDAADALVKAKSARAVPALIQTMGDPVESVRARAVRALASTATKTEVPLLLTALTDKDAHRRAGAATLLGLLNDRRAADP